MGWFAIIFVIIFMLMAVAIWYMRGNLDGYHEWVEDWWNLAKKYYENKK